MRNGDTAGQSRRGGRQPSATGLPIDYIFRPNDPTAPLLHHRPPRPLSTHFPEFTRFYRFFFSLSLNRVCSIFTGIFFDRYELNDRYDRTAPRTVSPKFPFDVTTVRSHLDGHLFYRDFVEANWFSFAPYVAFYRDSIRRSRTVVVGCFSVGL